MATSSRSSSKLVVLVAAGVAGLVLLISGISLLVVWNGVKNEGARLESQMNAVYSDGALTLSNCVVKTRQAANVATANANAFDQVIRDTIGRGVDVKSTAGRNSFYPMLVAAYPDLSGQTDLFNKVLNILAGCQDDFAGKQRVVADKIGEFDRFRNASLKGRTFAGSFPDDNLRISLPGINLSGAAALDKMRAPIVDAVSAAAYQTGEQAGENPFPEPAPSPTR